MPLPSPAPRSTARDAPALGQLLRAHRQQGDAVFVLFDLARHADDHRRFLEAAGAVDVEILDTRKTHPGWRVLEKYAVRAGGGTNHRMGLFDGCLIKDNHLAAWNALTENAPGTIAEAIRQARSKLGKGVPVEVEVDTLEQLRDALTGGPDIVLLDNMPPAMLREAVSIRDSINPGVLLEASGGISLESIFEIAQTGVERISIGALTHSAPACDIAFDWSGFLKDQ
jgi:nicotinate-nucleotide pyrophosphorylase (carboxylating)